MLKNKVPKRGAFDYLLDGNAIHVEPPPQPPRREPPGRVRIEIEIMDTRRRANEAREAHRASWALVFFVIVLILALAAHGQERWQPNRVGSQTYWYNPDSGEHGQEWKMPDGSLRSEWQDHEGKVTSCVVQKFGNTISKECH
jgi:hypothetical protein